MSILPLQNLDPASSSSSRAPLYQNPNSQHGDDVIFQSQHPGISPSLLRQNESLESLRLSDFQSSIGPPNTSGLLASPAQSPSCQKVKSVKLNVKKSVVHQKGDGNSWDDVARGSFSSSQRSPSSQAVVSSTRQEMGHVSSQSNAMHSSGRKTRMVNGNHLLNFHYDPISRAQPRAPPARRAEKRKPYNKDLFLQANYTFVVLDSGDHQPELLNPDKMLQWEDILCVRFSTPSPVHCPICLETPLCPQITSCGHIFCFPCILRYFSLGGDDHNSEIWKKCPLCFTMISSKDLCTIHVEYVKHLHLGDTVDLLLLTRHKDSSVLSLKNKQGIGTKEEAPDSFSKLSFTSKVDLSVREAISELDGWLARVDSGLEDDLEKLPFVSYALEQLEERNKYWIKRQVCNGASVNSSSSQFVVEGSIPASIADNMFNCGPQVSLNDDKSADQSDSKLFKLHAEVFLDPVLDVNQLRGPVDAPISSSGHLKDLKVHENGLKDKTDKKENNSYNFYQAVDGQYIILHPLNLKCLLHHYGSYEDLPHRIGGKILELESVTQSEAIRKRYRFISHFSLTTTFQLCEIDLSEMLPSDSLLPFMDEIKNRENRRKRLAKKEQKEKIKAETEAISHDLFMHYQSEAPTFSIDEFEALGNGNVVLSPLSSSPQTTTVGGGERKLFSSVTRLGFAAAHDSPALRGTTNDEHNHHSLPKLEINSSSSSGGSKATTGIVGTSHTAASFANVISRKKSSEGGGVVDAQNNVSELLGKKGKKPNRILLSTAGARRY
ncbi:RING finger protein 10 [Impatiens glandulifera]|uniref:RING finger protein 10 n=1 Tax=Impatiens glandulifera TaxID=253017 RepID=UPI001FB12885|nr:RING finger protein 10 [Impatiens glandulifera]